MIRAEIIKGMQDPSKGLATANIETPIDLGVYVCKTNYGSALAVCIRKDCLEVHIIGFDGDIYGETLEISDLMEISKDLFLNIGLIINNKCVEDCHEFC